TKPRTAMTASGNSFFMNSLLVSVHAVEAPRAAAPCRRLSDALPQERLAITRQILCLSPTGEAVVYGANGNARRQEKNEKNMAVTAPRAKPAGRRRLAPGRPLSSVSRRTYLD